MKLLLWLFRSHENSKGQMPLMMRITLNGKRINFSTSISIPEKTWDKNKQVIKGNDPLILKYNNYLASLKTRAWDFYNERVRDGKHVTAEQVKQYVLGNDSSQYTLLEAIDYQLDSLRARVGKDIALGTVKNYETAKSKVKAFLKHKGLSDLTLAELNHTFIHELDHFMRVQQGINNNGVAKNMQQLRRIIRVAILNDWMEKDPFAKYQCKIIEPKRVHLTWEELQRLDNYPVANERLERVRDVFVFCCWTGLAYVDVSKLSAEHITTIDGTDWILLDRTKTKNQSSIPLFHRAKELIEKYRDPKRVSLLPVISSQNMNKYLKEIATLAKIPKTLTVHVGRHTFASTVTLNRGVDIATVSSMLGHKMIRTTQIYARVNLQKIASDVKGLMNPDR